MVRVVGLGVLMAFVGGFAFGRWAAPQPEESASIPTVVQPEPVSWTAHCPAVPVQDCTEFDLALQFCEAQLAVSRLDRAQPKFPWGTTDGIEGVETPSTWVPTIEEAFAECDIPADLVAMDCSEPPCVGGLRGHASTEDIDRALHDCAPFADRFGEDRGGVMPVVTRCPDGTVQRMYLLATYDEDAVDAYFQAMGIRDNTDVGELDLWFEGFRILARRTDALASQWDCSGP